MNEWVKLGDIADISVGFPFKSELFNTNQRGVRLVRGVNVTERELRFGVESRWWDDESVDLNPYYLAENDIVIGMDGSKVGKNFSIIKKEELPLLLVQRVACIRAKDGISQKFLWAWISSSVFTHYVDLVKTGSTIFHISSEQIGDFPILLPNYNTQEQFGNIIFNIDTKISNNNAINAELEALAKTIYDYWFLQFEFPNEEGLPYKSSGGKMVWSEELKREIPEGWEVEQLGTYIDVERGISYKSEHLIGSGIPMINLNSINPNFSYKPEGIKSYSGQHPTKKSVNPFDLLVAVTQQTSIDLVHDTDVIGKSFFCPDIFDSDVVYSMDMIKLIPKERLDKYYLHYLFKQKFYRKYITGFANGTKIKHLDVKGILEFTYVIPDSKTLKRFSQIAEDIEKKKSLNLKENLELAALRDWLLPMLMNGQVGFKEDSTELV